MVYSTDLSQNVTLKDVTKTAIASVQVPAYNGVLNGNNVYAAFRFAPDFSKTNLQRMKDMGYATFRVTYGVEGDQNESFEPTLAAGGTYVKDNEQYRLTNRWYTVDFDIDTLLEAQNLLAIN